MDGNDGAAGLGGNSDGTPSGLGGPDSGDASFSDGGIGGLGEVSFGMPADGFGVFGLGLEGLFSDPASFSAFTDAGLPGFDMSSIDMSSFPQDAVPMSQADQGFSWQDAMNTVRGFLSKAGLISQSKGLQTANQVFNSTPVNLAMSKNPSKSWGEQGLTTALGMAFGLPGALAGMGLNALGFNGLANALGNVTATGTPAATSAGNTGLDALFALGGIYGANKAQRSMGDMLGGLQSLYSQDSPYAQALRQQLARKDAASGRRSQYGPREVELQARLAQMASGQIPAMSQLAQQQAMARNMKYQQALGLYKALGGGNGLMNLFSYGAPGLRGMENLTQVNPFETLQTPEIPDLGSLFGLIPPGG